MKLLHIDSSILAANSATRPVAAAIVDRLRKGAPGLEVTYRDLSRAPLPHLTLAHLPSDHPLAALAASADVAALAEERHVTEAVLEEFLAADIVVIGAPMYNFTIPSQLKAWIDRIVISGKTFRYGAEGIEGLARGKRVIIAIARGGFYTAGTPFAAAEHLETYLRSIFAFIGITNPEIIAADGIALGPEQRQIALDGAMKVAADLSAA